MENIKISFSKNGRFNLGHNKEIETNRFFEDSIELAKFSDRMLAKDDDHSSI